MAKIRIDKYLVENGYFETREKAKRSIMAGIVLVNEQPVYKAGDNFDPSKILEVRIKGDICPYASRGGLKLKKAIDTFNLDFNEKVMLDVGASTGGFTDCALIHGAKQVYALDVGTNQLIYRLREDSRVVVQEQTNFRTIEDDFFPCKFDYITMDVSFISTKLLIENVWKNLADDGYFICLIKPQFEAGKDAPRNNKGVITDPSVHNRVVKDFVNNCLEVGLYVNKIIYSPIKGGSGNVEFLSLISKNDTKIINENSIDKLIKVDHNE